MKKIIVLLVLLSVINLYVFSDIYEASIYKLKSGDVTIENARITDDYIEFILSSKYEKDKTGILTGVYRYKGKEYATSNISIINKNQEFCVRWNYKEDGITKAKLKDIDFDFTNGVIVASNKKITENISRDGMITVDAKGLDELLYIENERIYSNTKYLFIPGKKYMKASGELKQTHTENYTFLKNNEYIIKDIELKWDIDQITISEDEKRSTAGDANRIWAISGCLLVNIGILIWAWVSTGDFKTAVMATLLVGGLTDGACLYLGYGAGGWFAEHGGEKAAVNTKISSKKEEYRQKNKHLENKIIIEANKI